MEQQTTSKLVYPEEIKKSKFYVLVSAAALILSYGGYALFDYKTMILLGKEDGFFEYMTAVFFFIASAAFFAAFVKYRSWFLLLMALVFFFGCGEEISWGQRLLGYDTPDAIEKINVQGEFSLHNIKFLNSQTFDENRKTGLRKLLTINFQYKLFWLVYGVLLPISVLKIPPIASFFRKVRVPIPPLSIGIFFLVNWLTYRMIFLSLSSEEVKVYHAAGEIMECMSALLFMLVGLYFYRNYERGSGKGAQRPLEPHRPLI